MAPSVMYPAKAGSPTTYLTADILASTLILPLAAVDGLLPEGTTGILVLGPNTDHPEAIVYGAHDIPGKTVTASTRGLEGSAQSWPAGTVVGRFQTAYDQNSIQENLSDVITRLWNGSQWVPLGSPELSGLTDVNLIVPVDGNALIFRDGEWGNEAVPGGGSGGDAATLQTHPASDFALVTALGTAAAKNVPATGDAAGTEVVLGADTRMTNARTPTTHNHDPAYAPIAKGVTNGDSHDHNGGDGGQIAFGSLSGAPTSMAPTAHAASHATGQADAITPAGIGAEPAITVLPISKGGSGSGTAPTAGQLLVGKTDGSFNRATITAGTNVTVTNADGAITIASAAGPGVSRLAAIPTTISILTSDAGAGKSGTIDLTATTGQIARIRLRADFLAGQQATPGTFQVNNTSGISATATAIAYDSVSAGMVLATGGGDIIQIDGERILTATGTTTTSIAVAARGYNGTVATYHDDNAVGFKCLDGLRLELYPNSSYLPTERLLTLRGLMTGRWLVGAAGVTNGSSFIPLTTSPAVLSDFGAGSLLAILDTATDYARVQDIYGLVADAGSVNSIRTQSVRPAHAASTVVQRVLEYDLPVSFAFASGTSLYYKLFVDEKYTATVTVNVELIVDKYT